MPLTRFWEEPSPARDMFSVSMDRVPPLNTVIHSKIPFLNSISKPGTVSLIFWEQDSTGAETVIYRPHTITPP